MRIPINPPINVTQGFGVPEVGSAFGYHSGIDYGCPTGTPVYACISGTVSTVFNDRYHGNVVDIHNGDKWYRVMHLQKFVVTSGTVTEGQLIAYANNTGFSTGPHVHWDIRTQYVPTSFAAFINPETLLNQGDTMPTEQDVKYYFSAYEGNTPTQADIQYFTTHPWRKLADRALLKQGDNYKAQIVKLKSQSTVNKDSVKAYVNDHLS